MKNLNVKQYHQAYHPYNLTTNFQQPNPLQIQQQQLQSSPYTATPTQRFNSSISYNLPASVVTAKTTATTNPSVNNINNLPPPTLGGYLANQQQQRIQQQQQHFNQQLLQPQSQQQQINMLSLNQTNNYNYNLHFNATNNINLNHSNNHTNSNNNSNINNSNNHNNSALSRPQRPNSLNISAMASLALPSSFSATASTSSSGLSTSTTNSGLNFNPNQYYNHRENLFNFPTIQQQQQQQHHNNNHNNYVQQQNYNNYNMHHNQSQQQQQQQQHLQQFQFLQQQLKQQHQQNSQLNNICDLTTPVSSCSATSTPCAIPTTTSAVAINNTNIPTTSSQTNNNNNCNNNTNCDKLTMDACEIANFLANELFMQQLVSMECMQTGVPTLTTPTLTPTTLKSIEETFTQLVSEPINAPYQAGFIPPPLGSYNAITTNTTIHNNNNSTITSSAATTTAAGISPNNSTLMNIYGGDLSTGNSLHDYGTLDSETENSQGSWNENHLNEENSMATTDNSSAATDTTSFQNGLSGLGVNNLNNSNSSTTNDFTSVNLAAIAVATAAAKMSNANTSSSATKTTPRRGGGRRPATNSNMSPEEEEKRRIRRERNKLAAARCRKRRVDQTNELTDEVNLLERKREDLQKQIESLNGTKQDLEFILEVHRPACQRVVNNDMLSDVNTFAGLMPSSSADTTANDNITGLDTSLATTARSISPLDLKPVLNDHLLDQIKAEPLDSTLDSNSSLDQDGPPSPKRLLLHSTNPMIPPPLPNVATLSASLAAASASLNTPIVTTAPISFGNVYSHNPILNAPLMRPNSKQRPNSLPTIPRNLAQSLALGVNDNKPPTDINGVAIQTPSTGMFNFDSLMDGGTGLTPVSGPLVPNCSSQNKHPLEMVTPTSESSKLVSL